LLDRNIRWLRVPLEAAGYQVEAVGDPGKRPVESKDHEVLDYARRAGLIVVTHDREDYPAYHRAVRDRDAHHAGILALVQPCPKRGRTREVLSAALVAVLGAHTAVSLHDRLIDVSPQFLREK